MNIVPTIVVTFGNCFEYSLTETRIKTKMKVIIELSDNLCVGGGSG